MTPSKYIQLIGRAVTMEQKCDITDQYMREGSQKAKDWIKLYEDNINKMMMGVSFDTLKEFAMRGPLEMGMRDEAVKKFLNGRPDLLNDEQREFIRRNAAKIDTLFDPPDAVGKWDHKESALAKMAAQGATSDRDKNVVELNLILDDIEEGFLDEDGEDDSQCDYTD